VVDACRHVVRQGGTVISLATRPVLFTLARSLGEAWPGDVPTDLLLSRAFGARLADESHRARLRVKVGPLRCFGGWPMSPRRSEDLRCRRAAYARSWCWRGPSKASMRRCLLPRRR
jgi:hypothetical protein